MENGVQILAFVHNIFIIFSTSNGKPSTNSEIIKNNNLMRLSTNMEGGGGESTGSQGP